MVGLKIRGHKAYDEIDVWEIDKIYHGRVKGSEGDELGSKIEVKIGDG